MRIDRRAAAIAVKAGHRVCARVLLSLLSALAGGDEPGRVVEGRFLVDGRPKVGVQVHLMHDLDDFSRCGDAKPAAVTDTDGRFHARAHRYPIRLSCRPPPESGEHYGDGHVCR